MPDLVVRRSAVLGPDWYVLQVDGADLYPSVEGTGHEWAKIAYALASWNPGQAQKFSSRRCAVYVDDGGVYFWNPGNGPASFPGPDVKVQPHSVIPGIVESIAAARVLGENGPEPLSVELRPSIAEKVAHVRAAKQTREHVCHAEGCERQVKPAFAMCLQHWRMVPQEIRQRVWREYALGQEAGKTRVTGDYIDALNAAIEAVAVKEGRRA